MKTKEVKQSVGYAAVDRYVKSGMKVGLGTGSTAYFAIERLAHMLKSGELTDVQCVATSKSTEALAKGAGIPLTNLKDVGGVLNVGIDGADEIDSVGGLLKGRGGILLRERIVASCCQKFVVVCDESKLVTSLGKGAISVEIVKFEHTWTMAQISRVQALARGKMELRMSTSDPKKPFETDSGHYIVNVLLPFGLVRPQAVARELRTIPGVVDHGLFLGMATEIMIGKKDGTIETRSVTKSG
eukprot:GHVU01106146.1.p2 GENE.GHVU01106146.1~~GHVU01106146.1.p2  ORF type:complete len:242 (+),score=42.79 GHVU01106146.1:260-985(+)